MSYNKVSEKNQHSVVNTKDNSLRMGNNLKDSIYCALEATLEPSENKQLYKSTQSLLMASSITKDTCILCPDNTSMTSNVFTSLTAKANEINSSGQITTEVIDVQDLLRENRLLRKKLNEITFDRDRLLHKLTNVRIEPEVSLLPKESFPQKLTEGSIDSYNANGSQVGPTAIDSSTEGDGYAHILHHYASSSPIASNVHSTFTYPSDTEQARIMIHHHLHNNATYLQQSNAFANVVSGIPHDPNVNIYQRHHYCHNALHEHCQELSKTMVVADNGAGTNNTVVPVVGMPCSIQKKNSIRGGEILKRSRAQTGYELSQDLLEKQIELLERKYGGLCARNAAITIQRAFRHYMMVKKFASITAMAKTEKRLNRRTLSAAGECSSESNSSTICGNQSELKDHPFSQISSQTQPKVTIMAGPPGGGNGAVPLPSVSGYGRAPPTRSLSMRERRQIEGNPITRSQSGISSALVTSSSTAGFSTLPSSSGHPHVNLLHATESHYFTGHYPSNQYSSYQQVTQDVTFANSYNNSQLETSFNSSWLGGISGNSPHTPYYSAAQIYMRPKISNSTIERKKTPPEVPKRTSSITAQQHAQHLIAQQQQHIFLIHQTANPPSMQRSNGLCKNIENGSITSVQSSGSDSSITSTERILNSDISSDRSHSPNTWTRAVHLNTSQNFLTLGDCSGAQSNSQNLFPPSSVSGVSNYGNSSTDDQAVSSHTSAAQYEQHELQQDHHLNASVQNFKVSETIRKRQYRVGLNLFNKKPEKGITYLIKRGFLENTPQGVARFLISRKGLSRQMIGEYLGNLQNQFNMAVLNCFALELDLSGMQVDVALRKFQAYFRMPGEAQKIERLMEIFSQRYCQCNQDIVGRLRSSDTIFVLAFAIIMLNTDLHTPSLKPERRMRMEDFIKNLRGIDDCHDIDKDMLAGVYERVKANEFKPGSDHVTQVLKVQATIVGKKPNLALPHRRLVCYCRLYEIPDVNKKERPGVHQREVFLFNDLLVITKIFSKKKASVTYTFRNSFPLCGMIVTQLDILNYPFCIQLSQKVDGKNLITFNARNEHDRCKFAEDLKESISEMDEMETLRIEAELDRQKSARTRSTGSSENRDSGVADVEVCPCPFQGTQAGDATPGKSDLSQQQLLKRSALSNSLLDMHEQFGNDKPQRRGSVGSLDSGMSISFQSTATSNMSRDNPSVITAAANVAATKMRYNLQTSSSNAGATAELPSYYINNSHSFVIKQSPQQSFQQLHHTNGRFQVRERKQHLDEGRRSTEV